MTTYRTPATPAQVDAALNLPDLYPFEGEHQACPGCGLCVATNMDATRVWRPRRWYRRIAHFAWRCSCGYRWRELPKGRGA